MTDWLTQPERSEQGSVEAERVNHAIAKETGNKCLKTASLDWEAIFVSGHPSGAMTPANARETLTRQANRRRWAAQKARRSGYAGLLAGIRTGGA